MRTVNRHWMKAQGTLSFQSFKALRGWVLGLCYQNWGEQKGTLCGWDVSIHTSSRADFPGVRRKCWKMDRKWGIWWVADAKVTHYMLFQEVIRLLVLGHPGRKEFVLWDRFQCPEFLEENTVIDCLLIFVQFILTVCSLNCMFQY